MHNMVAVLNIDEASVTYDDCADDLLTVLNIDEASVTYDEIKAAFDQHFDAIKNIIVERARFNQRKQKPGESIDNFVHDLYRIAADCEYGTLKEELIRDRIVVGVLDDSLSEERLCR
eukprot:TRINITY_DN47818_c1_g1_i8.p2 TRINITY_DN47818_c1_g1~~TRINITY_DN47818_c1_g1_i8.p2  ORF type:complete len:117 (+),score=20.76 TRINITY_DN47818_c1_g1_i8:452-802(+)